MNTYSKAKKNKKIGTRSTLNISDRQENIKEIFTFSRQVIDQEPLQRCAKLYFYPRENLIELAKLGFFFSFFIWQYSNIEKAKRSKLSSRYKTQKIDTITFTKSITLT